MRSLLIALAILAGLQLQAQDREYARRMIDTLSSSAFYGRGYIDDGMGKAARFLAAEMQRIGLKMKGEDYLQSFHIPINTFPGPVELSVNGKSLEPGREFLVLPNAPSIQGVFKLKTIKPHRIQKKKYKISKPQADVFTVVPPHRDDKFLKGFSDSLRYHNPFGGRGIVRLSDKKIHWSQSGSLPQRQTVVLDVKETAWPSRAKRIDINIKAVPHPRYEVHNVFGIIEGTRAKDTFLLFTAHYDHLGMFGPQTLFPGANDNASGTAMIFDLARYFAENPPAWSVGFLACAAEESGLHGSEYFAENPLIPIEKIAFLINLDMVGTGSGGIRVVNGTAHPDYFNIMARINETDSLLSSVTAGGVSTNSDHYPFHKRGVPAFFIFTRGEEHREYHTPDDLAKDLPLTKYDEVFTILRRFAEILMLP